MGYYISTSTMVATLAKNVENTIDKAGSQMNANQTVHVHIGSLIAVLANISTLACLNCTEPRCQSNREHQHDQVDLNVNNQSNLTNLFGR